MTGPAQSILETLRHRSVLVTTSAGRAIGDVITEAIRYWRLEYPDGFVFHHRVHPDKDSGPYIGGMLLTSLRSISDRNLERPFSLPLPFDGEDLADKLLVELWSVSVERKTLIVLEGVEQCLDAVLDPFLAWLPVPPPDARYLLVLDGGCPQAKQLSGRTWIATLPLEPGGIIEPGAVADEMRGHDRPSSTGGPESEALASPEPAVQGMIGFSRQYPWDWQWRMATRWKKEGLVPDEQGIERMFPVTEGNREKATGFAHEIALTGLLAYWLSHYGREFAGADTAFGKAREHARRYLEQALGLLENKCDEETGVEAAIGRLYLSRLQDGYDSSQKAQRLVSQAEPVLREACSGDPLLRADLLTDIGWSYREIQPLENASPYLRDALILYQEHLGPEHLAVGNAWAMLATYSMALELPEEESCLRKAMGIYRCALGETHPKLAAILRDLSWLEVRRGRQKQSRKLLTQALKINRSALGSDHMDTTMTSKELGVTTTGG